jgi:hypothetical protein
MPIPITDLAHPNAIKLAYCGKCMVPIAFGAWNDKFIPVHTIEKTGEVHKATVVIAEREPMNGDDPATFLARIMKKYAK